MFRRMRSVQKWGDTESLNFLDLSKSRVLIDYISNHNILTDLLSGNLENVI